MSILRRRGVSRFQARSADRDAPTDSKALSAVAKAIDEALAELEDEMRALSERIHQSRDSALAAADHDDRLWRKRDPAAKVPDCEDQMIGAVLRIRQLGEQIADLRFVRTTFHFRLGGIATTPVASVEASWPDD